MRGSIQIRKLNHPGFFRRVADEARRRGDRTFAKTVRELASERLLEIERQRTGARGPATPSAETPEPAAA